MGGQSLVQPPLPFVHPLSAIVAACHRDQSSNDRLTMDGTNGIVIKQPLTNH